MAAKGSRCCGWSLGFASIDSGGLFFVEMILFGSLLGAGQGGPVCVLAESGH
jgi:hypothetical protein